MKWTRNKRTKAKNDVNYIQQQYTNSVGMVKKGTINTGHSIYHDTSRLQLYSLCAPICSLLVSLLPGCHSGCVSIFIEKYNIRFGNQIYHVLELYKWISISYQSRRLLISLTPEMGSGYSHSFNGGNVCIRWKNRTKCFMFIAPLELQNAMESALHFHENPTIHFPVTHLQYTMGKW